MNPASRLPAVNENAPAATKSCAVASCVLNTAPFAIRPLNMPLFVVPVTELFVLVVFDPVTPTSAPFEVTDSRVPQSSFVASSSLPR